MRKYLAWLFKEVMVVLGVIFFFFFGFSSAFAAPSHSDSDDSDSDEVAGEGIFGPTFTMELLSLSTNNNCQMFLIVQNSCNFGENWCAISVLDLLFPTIYMRQYIIFLETGSISSLMSSCRMPSLGTPLRTKTY